MRTGEAGDALVYILIIMFGLGIAAIGILSLLKLGMWIVGG